MAIVCSQRAFVAAKGKSDHSLIEADGTGVGMPSLTAVPSHGRPLGAPVVVAQEGLGQSSRRPLEV